MLSKWNSFLCRGLAVTGREERQLVQKQGPENRYKPSNFPHCLRLAFIWEISVDMDWFFKVWAILSGLHEVGSSLELWLTFAIFQGRHFNPYFVLYTHEVPIVEWSHFFFFWTFLLSPSEPSLPTRHNMFFQFEDGHGEPFSKGYVILRDKFIYSFQPHSLVHPLWLRAYTCETAV